MIDENSSSPTSASGTPTGTPATDGAAFGDKERAAEELDEVLASLDELTEVAPGEARATFDALPEEVRTLPDFQLSLAHICQRMGQLQEARDVVLSLLEDDPDDADAHHLAGDVLEDLEDIKAATAHFLETLRLDREHAEIRSKEEDRELFAAVEKMMKMTVGALPAEFQERLRDVPLMVEAFPSGQDVEEGLDPRALGVFDGPNHGERASAEAPPVPARIVVFAENLAANFEDPDEIAEQVRITVLHEVGHYFGLEEEDMTRLGLD